MKPVKCKSGLMGWQCRLQENYYSLGEWQGYCSLMGLHTRLGYKSPKTAWRHNPLIQGSVNPSDFCRVRSVKLKRYPKDVVIAHARKMNTKAAARRLMAVDSGPYKVSR